MEPATNGKRAALLISEPPLQVLPSLAVLIGLNEAIALQQLHYWLLTGATMHEGRPWVYNSYEQWQRDNFPFWSVMTIRRVFTSLERQGLIETRVERDNSLPGARRKWYTIDYEAVAALSPKNAENEREEGDGVVNLNTPYGQIEHTYDEKSDANTTKGVSILNIPYGQEGCTGGEMVGGCVQAEQTGMVNLNTPYGQVEQAIYKESETTTETTTETTCVDHPEVVEETGVIARAPDGAARGAPQPHSASSKRKPRSRNPFYDMIAEVWFDIKADTPEFAALGGRIAQHATWLSGKAITVKRRNGDGVAENVEIPGCQYAVTRELLGAAKRAWFKEYPGTTPPYDILKFVTWVGAWLTRNVRPTATVERRRDPNCDYCGGTGMVLPDVPPDHPLYNEVFPCPKCGTAREATESKESTAA